MSITKPESEHMDRVQLLGCIACFIDGVYSPAEIHHILESGRRKGHMYVLPLCVPHHRGNFDGSVDQRMVSRHPYKTRFEARYGTEAELLDKVNERLRAVYG